MNATYLQLAILLNFFLTFDLVSAKALFSMDKGSIGFDLGWQYSKHPSTTANSMEKATNLFRVLTTESMDNTSTLKQDYAGLALTVAAVCAFFTLVICLWKCRDKRKSAQDDLEGRKSLNAQQLSLHKILVLLYPT